MTNPSVRARRFAPPASAFDGARIVAVFVRAFDLLAAWQERASQRYRLRAFDERMLKDVGLSRADVEMEASKPFWVA